MRMRRTLAYLVFASCVVVFVVKNRAAEVRSGDWTISKSEDAGKVEFSLIEHHHGGTSSHQSDWPASSFQGVDFSKPGRQDVHFTIARDAGKIECEGFLNNGEGAGIFHFQPDANYPREMHALGFSVDDEKQFSMAVQDVSLEFAKQMKNEHLSDLDADKLIAFRIFRVDSAFFIEELRGAGLEDFRRRQTGRLPHPRRESGDGSQPSPGWLFARRRYADRHENSRRDAGMDGRTEAARLRSRRPEKLIAFRIHGVSPEFIQKLQGLGYRILIRTI